MGKRDGLTRFLAVAGAALVWIPILAPIILTAACFCQTGRFLFDYLMPAELFPSALGGGCLLVWAARRAHSQRRLTGWSLAAAVMCLVAGQGSAVATGLASGATEPAGGPLVLVLLLLAGYVLAVAAAGVGGLRLMRVLFAGRGDTPDGNPSPT